MVKKIITLLLAVGISIGLTPQLAAYASNDYDYYVKDSSQYLGQTVSTNGKEHGWYRFPDGSWGYYIDYGKLLKNTLINEVDGDYAVGETGRLVKGWFCNASNKKWYFFRSNGILSKGWLKVDHNWYYTDNNGIMLTGWQFINQKWYYFNKETGVMATNIMVDGYYLSSDGSVR